MERKVVTRFAPSPTGFMHVGNVHTGLFAFLLARKNNGTFILRIEDTDKAREVKGSIEHIIESLQWLGINWDEGPEIGGPHAPYLQSERLDLYKKYAQKLIDVGFAYPDPYTEDQLELFRKEAKEKKEPFLFRNHRPETFDTWDGTKPLRFKTPTIKTFVWHDLVFGDLSAGPEALDDFILIKSDGYPTYNFAHIVDDIEMKITHVVRGQEFISSTPKFLSVYEAFGIEPPLFASLPHILADGGQKKMGKRDGSKDVLEYRNEGYLPEALVNFLALLGWNPGHEGEIFSMDQLIKEFDIERVQKSGAQMNFEKLDWMNKEHIRQLDIEKRLDYYELFLPNEWKNKVGYTRTIMSRIDTVITDHIEKFSDLTIMAERGDFDYMFITPILDKNMIIWKSLRENQNKNVITKENLKAVINILESFEKDTVTELEVKNAILPITETLGKGETLWPTRVALTGLEKSPDPFTVISILGKNESITRIKSAIEILG